MAKKSEGNFRELIEGWLRLVKANYLVLLILIVFFSLMVGSILKESPTNDELAHSFSGYSYVRELKLKYNLEHPPLIKDLSGASILLFTHPKFPTDLYNSIDSNYWGWAWGLGGIFFYQLNPHPGVMLFFARLPMMLLGVFFGVMIYHFVKKYYGKTAGLFAVALFCFSPNVIAHSRYVTTDIGIALFFFLAIFTFIAYLEKPIKKNFVFFTASLMGALLTKFSFITLVPVLGLIFLLKPIYEGKRGFKVLWGSYFETGKWVALSIVLSIIGTALFYELHTLRMTRAEVRSVITSYLPNNTFGIQHILLSVANYIKGLPLFVTGFLYVTKHSVDGHTAFLMGKLYDKGLWYYFPTVFVLKTQLELFALLAIWIGILIARRKKLMFVEAGALIGIVVYLIFSMSSSINIGVRYILPIYPLIFFLVAGVIPMIKEFEPKVSKILQPIVWILLIFYVVEALFVYPYFTQYSNQLIWRKQDSYKYFVDSNLDWGQGLKELGSYVSAKNIKSITVDYLPNGTPVNYYVPNAVEWDPKITPNPQGYFAVSATGYQFYRSKYPFLNGKVPVDEIGYSILIFKL